MENEPGELQMAHRPDQQKEDGAAVAREPIYPEPPGEGLTWVNICILFGSSNSFGAEL
jgi:hypothetical protein